MKPFHLMQLPSRLLKQHFWSNVCPVAQAKTYSGKQQRDVERSTRRIRNAERKAEMKKKIPYLQMNHNVTINELAKLSNKSVDDIRYAISLVKKKKQGSFHDLVPLVVKQLGYRPQFISREITITKTDRDIYAEPVTTDSTRLVHRPPIVAVMGHVDHGKTTLLDALRQTTVAAGEAGGITQSVGAFSVALATGQTATFIDTPGHSVFTSLRERGAQMTDIVVLVVAADDGVMEQTIESINMAKMAEASIVVAVNKCDKKGVQPDLVLEELENYGVECEHLGGDVQAVKISALKNQGLDGLVKCIVTQSELLNLRSDPEMQVQGIVLESRVEKGRGPMASIIVRQGTLRKAKILIAGTSIAKVRQLYDSNGDKIDMAGPGMPVDVMGWRSLPHAGQMVLEVESEAKAKVAVRQREAEMEHLKADEALEVVEEKRQMERREYESLRQKHSSMQKRIAASTVLARAKNSQKNETPELNIIVKADVDGSMEALVKVLNSYDSGDKCQLKLVHQGIGDLGEKELELARESDAAVFLFNTDLTPGARALHDDVVTICKHKVIYHFVDELRARIEERLLPIEAADVHGEAEVLQIFPIREKKNLLNVAGCRVLKGVLKYQQMFRVIRSDEIIHRGSLASMKQYSKDVKECSKGMECGLLFMNSKDVDLKAGDKIECFSPYMEKGRLTWRPPGF